MAKRRYEYSVYSRMFGFLPHEGLTISSMEGAKSVIRDHGKPGRVYEIWRGTVGKPGDTVIGRYSPRGGTVVRV